MTSRVRDVMRALRPIDAATSEVVTRPKAFDFFCGGGGASRGYDRAGFEMVGFDLYPQRNYPYEFVQADAIEALRTLIAGGRVGGYALTDAAAIHASPVCHDWSPLAAVSGKDGSSELLLATLELLPQTGLPWVVENVMGAPLARQATLDGNYGAELCGTMFGLRVLRHRLFEASFPLPAPPHHGAHVGTFYAPAGHGNSNRKQRERNPDLSGDGYADRCREAMGIDWMNRDELAQAIPPAPCGRRGGGRMTAGPTFNVGQTVYVYDVNMRGEPQEATITKVGRTLVTVRGSHWTKTYRMNTGKANDNYGHSWILTTEQKQRRERELAARAALRERGVELNHRARRLTAEQLEAMVSVIDEAGA